MSSDRSQLLADPKSGESLSLTGDMMHMGPASDPSRYPVSNGVPLLFVPNNWDGKEDVTDIVKGFYEETPFPGYDGIDTMDELQLRTGRTLFARILNETLPADATVLEAGCGTGQLSNLLASVKTRTLFGADMCLNSLGLANQFKVANQLDNLTFAQMNLFRPPFKEGSFDYVICSGVLHHTADPLGGFKSLLKLVRPGGYVLIGLYNLYGRMPLNVRRFIFNISGDRFKFLDRRLRDTTFSEGKKHTWFMDQYKHPHESSHSYGEVLGWFKDNGVRFVSSLPQIVGEDLPANPDLFAQQSTGSALQRQILQFNMMIDDLEGGFFIMVGQKEA